MKITRPTQSTQTQETQESQNTTQASKGTRKSPRAASGDSVEMTSAARNTETSGARQLSSDQQSMAGNIDPENYTSLRSGADPRAAIESTRAKNGHASQSASGRMPNGSTVRDLSQYNVQTNAPESLKESIGQLGQRADQLKSGGRNAADMFTNPLANQQSRSGAARSYMNAQDGVIQDAWNWVKEKVNSITSDGVKEAVTEATIEAAAEASGKTGGAIVETVAAPLTGINTVQEVLGKEEGPKAYLNGWRALLGDPDKRPGMPGKDGIKDVPPDIDGMGGSGDSSRLRGPGLDSIFPVADILQGVTGKGPGGGEVVNPSPEATGDGKVWVDQHGAFQARLGYDNSKYLIGQTAGTDEEQGFNGLSGSGGGGRGGSVDFEDGSGYQGALKTDEPGNVRTTPRGDGTLGHLIENNDDEEDNDGRK